MKPEFQNEVDDLLAQLRSPAVLHTKTTESQAQLAESLLLFVVDLINEQEWDRAWQTADIAEHIARNL